jgi:MOSC domain-containing protein YiiM
LDVIARLAHVAQVDPVGLRRNLVVSGINLLALKNARLEVGAALLEVVGPCQPCSRMEETVGAGGYDRRSTSTANTKGLPTFQ